MDSADWCSTCAGSSVVAMGYSIVEPTLDVDADLVTTHRHIDPPWVRWRPWSVNFHRCFVALNLSVELLLELRGWNVAEVAV